MKRILAREEFFDDDDIYSEDVRTALFEDGEISPEEEAFMRGYDES